MMVMASPLTNLSLCSVTIFSLSAHDRVSTSIFMRHYFNLAWIGDLKERALKVAEEILEKAVVLKAA